ncbi:NADH-quinone oxidoreductase subunit F [Caloramator quimbayensis]|uniref:NADH-quinone oxidoreductase subunit F n=1 Tax=Caloramator quimbayensis TaxID=1147123 RepID=A0A1T4Y8E8_9CLOT|nr:NADH-quinone oxidoreductase subunit NuoF [Caloramator quimbayensis]SKA98059.1 NADH-quinone oxidoreductase subunit F [Caloramator quimbayensis]
MSDRKIVKVCCGTGCLANGSGVLFEKLLEKSKIKGDFAVDILVKSTGCNGLCEKGPLIKIEPDGITYCKVKLSDIDEIYEKTILKGEAIERLLFSDSSGKKTKSHKDTEFYKRQVKLALRNIGEIDPTCIEDYIERDGYKAIYKALFEMTPEDIIKEVEKSKIRGRGGAGFLTYRKWMGAKKVDSFPKYVVCNGDEGDPGAFMDRSVMEGDPHSIIEGMIICARYLDSHKGYIYIRDEYGLAIKNMKAAIEDAKNHGYLGKNILGSGFDFDIEIVRGGGAFVCGESTALMSSIEGKVGEPRAKYIHSNEKGLWGQPTVLNNVETWANIPLIILKGGEWFAGYGTENSKGTKVFSLVGKVKNTGLVEVPMGTTLRELIFDIGGGIIGNKKFKAVQTGGPSGGCIPEGLLDLKVDFDTLTEAGSMMGSGGMIVMDERTCMVDVARYYIKFLSEESCGKCAPCREGIKRMLEILTDICEGRGKEGDIELLEEICSMVESAALCGLGKTAPNPVMTTLKYFKDEYIEHIENKRCPAGVCKNLTTFFIDSEKCVGCGLCRKNCPADCISGEIKKPHFIDASKCIKCGSCIENCRFSAVKVK